MYKSFPSGSGGVAYDFPMIVLSNLWWKKAELFLHVEELPQSSQNFYFFVLFYVAKYAILLLDKF